MMGIGPGDARSLSYCEYQGLLWNWNARHNPDRDNDPVEAPSTDFVLHRQHVLEAKGFGRMVH